MWLRARLDVTWRDLAWAAAWSLCPGRRDAVQRSAMAIWGRDDCLLTLSVRSAFDLVLRALRLPAGSEVLLSALTVPDMARVIEAHQLVPVPVDVDEHWRLCRESLRQAVSDRSRVLVVAHLFGDREGLTEVLELARRHGLIVVEDCAQSFAQVGDPGHSDCDLVLHSFGPIKTATALGGAVVRVRSDELRADMEGLLADDPVQSRWNYLKRAGKSCLLKFLSGPWTTAVLWRLLTATGVDVDDWLNSLGRSFRRDDLLSQLRQQPSTPLLRMLARRWRIFDRRRIDQRRALGRRLDAALGRQRGDGDSYWVYPIVADDPHGVVQRLRRAGYDATARSRMVVVPPVDSGRRPERAADLWNHVVFLPWYPELTTAAVDELGALLRDGGALVRGALDENDAARQIADPAATWTRRCAGDFNREVRT